MLSNKPLTYGLGNYLGGGEGLWVCSGLPQLGKAWQSVSVQVLREASKEAARITSCRLIALLAFAMGFELEGRWFEREVLRASHSWPAKRHEHPLAARR
jgi:hypothetical protein